MWQSHNSQEDVEKWSKGLQGQKREVRSLRSLLLVLGTLVLTSPHAIRITYFCLADSIKSLHKKYIYPLKII